MVLDVKTHCGMVIDHCIHYSKVGHFVIFYYVIKLNRVRIGLCRLSGNVELKKKCHCFCASREKLLFITYKFYNA